MIRKISGTTAVITGATSGIGRETALEFARAGANVVIAGRRKERLHRLVRDIESAGQQALSVVTDVADQAQVDHLTHGSGVWLERAFYRRHASGHAFSDSEQR